MKKRLEQSNQRVSEPEYGWLSDPQVFAVNRLRAHSDHFFYGSEAEWKKGESSLVQSLNGQWDFAFAEKPGERQADFYQIDASMDSFSKIRVPGHIQLQGYDRCQYINVMYPWDGREEMRPPQVSEEYNPVGSYVKFFDLKEDFQGKRTVLSFQGAETAFYVWLNGRFLGYSEDSFTPSEFEITEFVQMKNNKLAVEVYKRSSASWIEDQDFWRFSGIFRDVFVYAMPKLHIFDLGLKADYDYANHSAKWSCSMDFVNDAEGTYQLELRTPEGIVQNCFRGDISDKVVLQEQINDIRPWSGEKPYLYDVLIFLFDRKKTLWSYAV